jgi:hypothetical protein
VRSTTVTSLGLLWRWKTSIIPRTGSHLTVLQVRTLVLLNSETELTQPATTSKKQKGASKSKPPPKRNSTQNPKRNSEPLTASKVFPHLTYLFLRYSRLQNTRYKGFQKISRKCSSDIPNSRCLHYGVGRLLRCCGLNRLVTETQILRKCGPPSQTSRA